MTVNSNEPAHERTAEAMAAKADGLKERAQEKAAQAKEAVTGHAGDAVRTTQEKAGQVKDTVSDLASKARENATPPAITSPPAVRGAGAAAVGVATALAVWLLRRRAKRNANPWRHAAQTAKSQIKTVRREAKSGLKAARKRSRAEAAAQVASARAKAHRAKARAKSWK
ncbi:hypothetical protein [Actinoallomurus acaciae]|uniref:DUF3618 domain-containing protein n=1 Tax=Actinoallomurus acaciae TaxID=502577 RepID=A0ABV5YAR1_9ACTN